MTNILIITMIFCSALFSEELDLLGDNTPPEVPSTVSGKITFEVADEIAKKVIVEGDQRYWDALECPNTITVNGGSANCSNLKTLFTNYRVVKGTKYAVFPAPSDRITGTKEMNGRVVSAKINWNGKTNEKGVQFPWVQFTIGTTVGPKAIPVHFFGLSQNTYIGEPLANGFLTFTHSLALTPRKAEATDDRIRFKIFTIIVDKP